MRIGFTFLSLRTLTVKKAISITKKLGGNTLELFGDLIVFYNGKFCEKPEKISEFAEKNDIFLTMHLPYININLASFNDLIWRESLNSILKAMEYGYKAGVKRAVLHPGGVPLKHTFLIYLAKKRFKRALNVILEKSEEFNMEITLENTYFKENDIFNGVEDFRKFVEGFDGRLKICFDFGHANISLQGINHSLDLLKPFITHLHVHDNNGEKDEHLYIGGGRINFTEYIDFIKNFKGTIILEINPFKKGRKDLEKSIKMLKGEG